MIVWLATSNRAEDLSKASGFFLARVSPSASDEQRYAVPERVRASTPRMSASRMIERIWQPCSAKALMDVTSAWKLYRRRTCAPHLLIISRP